MGARAPRVFELVEGRSPFEIESLPPARAEPLARQGLVPATAFSAIEQALWDLAGKALDVPTHVALRRARCATGLPVYANINRATNPRTPDGFAAAATRSGRRRIQDDQGRALGRVSAAGIARRRRSTRRDRRRDRRRARDARRRRIRPSAS